MDMVTILLAAAFLLLAAGVLFHVRRIRRLMRELRSECDALRARVDTLAASFEQSSLDASALRISTVGLGAQIERLERAQNLLQAHIGQLERSAGQESSYAHAIRQVARGHVGVEELMQDFGLARGEAELLLRMHRHASEEDALAQRLREGG